MNRLIAWFATNHVAANLLMAFAVLAGFAALGRVPMQLFPDIDVPIITVTVPYLGAAPEEVESGVCMRIEERLEGIEGIKELRSVAAEGLCTVHVELFFDTDRARALDEVQNQVNAIDTFPVDTERPIVEVASIANVVLEIAVTGPADERGIKELGERVREDILALPGVTHATLLNTRPYEISVEVSEESLSRNNLTFDDVAAALRQRSLDLPGGSVQAAGGEILLRTMGQAYWGPELERLPVTTRNDGTRILVRDVARVVDGFADTNQALRFDGRRAALIQVSRVGSQNVRDLAGTVRRFVAESPSRYAEGVELTVWRDESTRLEVRLGALLDSGLQGLLLVLLLLALFLRPHLALWVATGIPVAFLGAIFLIYWLGFSIDGTSVMGFILALGMLVDDAVVIGEGTYTAQRRGAGQLAGAIEGTQQILVPVTFGVLTTIVAFLPLLFAVGRLGQVMGVMAATVICCLVFSLVECLLVLPAHLGHRSARMPLGEFGVTVTAVVVVAAFALTPDLRTGSAVAAGAAGLVFAAHVSGHLAKLGTTFARLQVRFESGLEWFIEEVFRRMAAAAYRQRLVTATAALGALGSAAALVFSGHLPYSYSTPTKGDRIVARLTMPAGTNAALTDAATTRLADTAWQTQRELGARFGEPVVLHVMEATGTHLTAGTGRTIVVEQSGNHLSEVVVELTPGETRDITTDDVAALWRELNGPVAGGAELVFITDRFQVEPDIDIRISGNDTDGLRAVVAAIREELRGYPGVYDVTDSFQAGKEELRLSVSPAGEALGVTLSDLGRQVRQAFYGEEALRVQRGRDDVRVMVRYPEHERRSLDSLYALRVRTPDGGEVPFGTVAEVREGRSPAAIARTNGVRNVNLAAEVDPSVSSAEAALARLDSGFLEDTVAAYPGVSYALRSAERQSAMGASLGPLFLFALFAVYGLLAMPLRSYAQPLMVMAVLPFAFMGAVWGHALVKPLGIVSGLSMFSIFGMLAASGVVINSTLVLMHGVNRYRAAGDAMSDALVKAAASRFRPILITTVTTLAGLLPLILTDSVHARPMVPMATSLAFGILFSGVAALLAVPAVWLLAHDVSGGGRRLKDLLGGLVGAAPRLTTWVSRYPYVQESLRTQEFTDLQLPDDLDLGPEAARIARRGLVRVYYEREFDAGQMRAQFAAMTARAPLTDDLVGEARIWAEQRTFQLGVHMARAVIAPRDAARPLSDILETCLAALLHATKREFVEEHGDIPNDRVALVALGAAGRREFATGAPLGLLFLYDHDPVPAGVLTMAPETWHERLLQRLARLIGELSPEGMLYRHVPPSRLALSVDRRACSWQELHEAFGQTPHPADLRMLCHARVIESEGGLGTDFEGLRQSVLARTHDLGAVARETRAARERYGGPRGRRGDWDVARMAGGLGDLELAAQYLELADPSSERNVRGLADTFEAAGDRQLLQPGIARQLADAAILWQDLDGFFRMTSAGTFDPATASTGQLDAVAAMAGTAGFEPVPAMIAARADFAARQLDTLLAQATDVQARGTDDS